MSYVPKVFAACCCVGVARRAKHGFVITGLHPRRRQSPRIERGFVMAHRVAHIYGLVRRAEIQSKDGAPYGTRLSILSEPQGDTVEILAFARDLQPLDALALVDTEVHATVSLDVSVSQRGAAFLNTNLISVEPGSLPVFAGSKG